MGSVTQLTRDQQIGRQIGMPMHYEEVYCMGCSEGWLDDEYFGPTHDPLTAGEAHDCEVILVCDSCGNDILPVVYRFED